MKLRPRNARARYAGLPVPLPVVLALLYSGLMSLVILWMIHAWPTPMRSSFLPTAAWVDSGGAEAFRRLYRGIHLLLLGYLWLSARGGVGGRLMPVRWSLAVAALLVLAVHRALDSALNALPRVEMVPWPMG
jgi:hypothetical protein